MNRADAGTARHTIIQRARSCDHQAGRKYITACANLSTQATKSPAIAPSTAIVRANAAGEIFTSPRSLHADVEHIAATMPMISIVDGELLNARLQRSLRA